MKRFLRILDVSSFAYAGLVNQHSFLEGEIVLTDDGYKAQIVPTGGVSLIFNVIAQHYHDSDFIFCCDRNATYKKEMLPSYKGTRNYNVNVESQKRVIERILEDCGFTVLYEDGFEADDFIYTATRRFSKYYEHTYVYTGDSDLYLCVTDKVSIKKSASRYKDVDINNFYQQTGCAYNRLTYTKIIKGDRSDCIPPINKQYAKIADQFFAGTQYNHLMGDKVAFMYICEQYLDFLLDQAKLVFPLDTWLPDEIKEGDPLRINSWGFAIRNKNYPEGNTLAIRDIISEIYLY